MTIIYAYNSLARTCHMGHREETMRPHKYESYKAVYRFSCSSEVFKEGVALSNH